MAGQCNGSLEAETEVAYAPTASATPRGGRRFGRPLLPALHRPLELGGRLALRPDGLVRVALELDEIGRRERVLARGVELDAAIADHELVALQIGLPQRLLDLLGRGRAGAVDGVGENQEALHPARAGVVH